MHSAPTQAQERSFLLPSIACVLGTSLTGIHDFKRKIKSMRKKNAWDLWNLMPFTIGSGAQFQRLKRSRRLTCPSLSSNNTCPRTREIMRDRWVKNFVSSCHFGSQRNLQMLTSEQNFLIVIFIQSCASTTALPVCLKVSIEP